MTLTTKSYREFYGENSVPWLAFHSLERLPAGTFRRLCEERTEIVMRMIQNLMLLRLRTSDGELPFTVEPENYDSCRTIAEYTEMSTHEVTEHCEFLALTGLVDYFSQRRMRDQFFNRVREGEVIPVFPVIDLDIQKDLIAIPRGEIKEFIMNILLNKLVVTNAAISSVLRYY